MEQRFNKWAPVVHMRAHEHTGDVKYTPAIIPPI